MSQTSEFHYSNIMPYRPAVIPALTLDVKICECGVTFETKSRAKFRCDSCQALATKRSNERAQKAAKARRKALRAAGG